jgi:hypothetical protein
MSPITNLIKDVCDLYTLTLDTLDKNGISLDLLDGDHSDEEETKYYGLQEKMFEFMEPLLAPIAEKVTIAEVPGQGLTMTNERQLVAVRELAIAASKLYLVANNINKDNWLN